ncbi:MAG: hypothetical protein SynsKO_11950 [Synoicihabitans sp.]
MPYFRQNLYRAVERLLLLTVLLTGGCQTQQRNQTAEPVQPVSISRGMTTDQVTLLLGEPESIERVSIDAIGHEWWTYRYVRGSDVRMNPVHITKRPIFDPLTGAYREVDEPHYVPEVVEETETVKILFQADRVLRWTTETKKKTQMQE